LPRAEMPLLLYVKALLQRKEADCFASKLSRVFQNDLRPPVVLFHFSANLHLFPGKLTHLADPLQIGSKNNYGKRTLFVVFAKIQIVDAPAPTLHPQHFSADTLRLANVFLGLIKWNARGGRKSREQQAENCQLRDHTESLV